MDMLFPLGKIWMPKANNDELQKECGYDTQAIKEAVLEMMNGKVTVSTPVLE